MEYIYIIITIIVICILLWIILKLNPKQSKQIAENKELNEIAKKFPSNIEICKAILKKLNNENVKIEEDSKSQDCVYMVAFNKIIIAGKQNNFSRIQTIAHECIHSIQDKRIQMFNFVFSNICIFYFITMLILTALKILPYKMMFLAIYILLCFVQYVVRAYLENDAMIKAKFLAKEYIQEQKVCTQDEAYKLVDGFEQINKMGIKGYNYSLMVGAMTKIIILSLLFFFT